MEDKDRRRLMGQKRSACRNWVEESKERNHVESVGVEASVIYV